MDSSPVISLQSMQRARSTLEDFVSSYFMFHRLDASKPVHTFKHLPVLMFVEAFIYQLDQENENQLSATGAQKRYIADSDFEVDNKCQEAQLLVEGDGKPMLNEHTLKLADERQDLAGDVETLLSPAKRRKAEPFMTESSSVEGLETNTSPGAAIQTSNSAGIDCSTTQTQTQTQTQNSSGNQGHGLFGTPFAGLANMLEREKLMTPRIAEELKDGLEFWRLERKLCKAMDRRESLDRSEIEKAVALKSFDYRVLNLLLYKLEGEAVNEQHFEFLKASELLVEMSDDLFDYEDDVLNNTFNVYRMFLAMYGPAQGQLELAHWISDIERRYERLLSGLEADLAEKYKERCRSAAKEGGSLADSSSPMGSWTLPPPITDESAYREEMKGREFDAG